MNQEHEENRPTPEMEYLQYLMENPHEREVLPPDPEALRAKYEPKKFKYVWKPEYRKKAALKEILFFD